MMACWRGGEHGDERFADETTVELDPIREL